MIDEVIKLSAAREADSLYLSRQDALASVGRWYERWEQCWRPSTILISGFGLSGKTSFIRNDVATLLSDAYRSTDRVAFVHVDYDAFDHYPSEVDVLLAVRNGLAEYGFLTPHLDCGLRAYHERVDSSPFAKARLGAHGVASGVLGLGAAFAEALASTSTDAISIAAEALGLAAGFAGTGELLQAITDRLSRPVDVENFLSSVPDSTLIQYLIPLFADDLGAIGVRPCNGNVSRAACIALDGIGGSFGVQEGAWELSFAKATNSMTILSARAFPNECKDVRRVDLDLVREETMCELVNQYNVNTGLRDFLLRGNDGHPVSLGLARLCLDTIKHGLGTESELINYIQRFKAGAHGNQELTPEAVTSTLARDVLRVQLNHLPNDVVQVIYVLAWFEAVDPYWLIKKLSMLQPHSHALHLCRSLPYVIAEGEHSWHVHALIAHFIRQECDVFTVESLQSLLRGCVPSLARYGESEDNRRIREVIVRLQSHRVLYALGGIDDAAAVALPYVTLDGGLERWAGYFKVKWNGSERCLSEFEDMVDLYLSWNESMRGGGSVKELDRAERLNVVLDELRGLAKNASLSAGALERLELLRAKALVRCGAIGSDVYRHTSKLGYHREALRNEMKALKLRLGMSNTVIDQTLVDNINSVAVSAYRLLGYEYSIPLHSIALLAYGRCKDQNKTFEGRLLRNWATTLYSCAADIGKGLYRAPKSTEFAISFDPGTLLSDAEALCDAAARIDSGGEWAALMTKAECFLQGGESEEALAELDRVWNRIEEKGAVRSTHASRCLYLRARVEMERGKAERLSQAFEDALRAFDIRYQAGRFKTDTEKSYEQICSIKDQFIAMDLSAPEVPEKTRNALCDIKQLAEGRVSAGGDQEERCLLDDERSSLHEIVTGLVGLLGFDRTSVYQTEMNKIRNK